MCVQGNRKFDCVMYALYLKTRFMSVKPPLYLKTKLKSKSVRDFVGQPVMGDCHCQHQNQKRLELIPLSADKIGISVMPQLINQKYEDETHVLQVLHKRPSHSLIVRAFYLRVGQEVTVDQALDYINCVQHYVSHGAQESFQHY